MPEPCPLCGHPPPARRGPHGPAPKAHPACIKVASLLGLLERELLGLDLAPGAWGRLRKRLLGLANSRAPEGARRDRASGRWAPVQEPAAPEATPDRGCGRDRCRSC